MRRLLRGCCTLAAGFGVAYHLIYLEHISEALGQTRRLLVILEHDGRELHINPLSVLDGRKNAVVRSTPVISHLTSRAFPSHPIVVVLSYWRNVDALGAINSVRSSPSSCMVRTY